MQIPESKIKRSLIISIEAIVGKNGYSLMDCDRLSYSRDAGFRAAIQAHYSNFENFPGVIVWPKTVIELSQIIKLANKFNVAVTPYGGGSGVCGGATNTSGGILIDLKKMHRLQRVDENRLFVEAECGIYGLQLENELERRGFTLGHFPSSILVATLGGYLAARSAGQHSSKYGKIEDMIIDLEFVDGRGSIHRTSEVYRDKGLDWTQALVGSEGTLGIITKARLRIYPKPEAQRFHAFRFQKMEYGMEALRRIMQTGIKPDVLRLYDELDTMMMFSKMKDRTGNAELIAQVIPERLKDAVANLKTRLMALAFHSHRLINTIGRFTPSGCLFVIMLEGHPRLIDKEMELIQSICKAMGGSDEGAEPAHYWHEHRYSVSYKAPKLFTEGAFTDTMEVATTWDNMAALYHGVFNALQSQALVLAHVSHVYADGAAIYFTFVSPLIGLKRSLKAYDKLWQTALGAVQKFGGVISHHHGIGRLKSYHLKKEWGEAIGLYKQLKEFFDPNGILNPGVLLPREESGLEQEAV